MLLRGQIQLAIDIRRWGVETVEDKAPVSWWNIPGARSRPLARTIEHTEAMHRFMAGLVQPARRNPGCRVLQVSQPHHSAPYFRYRGRRRSIHPDGFGMVQSG